MPNAQLGASQEMPKEKCPIDLVKNAPTKRFRNACITKFKDFLENAQLGQR